MDFVLFFYIDNKRNFKIRVDWKREKERKKEGKREKIWLVWFIMMYYYIVFEKLVIDLLYLLLKLKIIMSLGIINGNNELKVKVIVWKKVRN